MSLAFNSILLLIAAGPVMMLASGAFAASLQMLITAIGLIAVAVYSSTADLRHARRAASGLVWLLALVPVWILIQLLPLPLLLSHSIWTSVADALPGRLFGHITVDLDETLSALLATLSAISILVVTTIVTRERGRAELILFATTAITTLLSVPVLIQKIKPAAALTTSSLAVNLSGIGIILNIAVIVLAFERRETRRRAGSQFILIAGGGALGLALNAFALFDAQMGAAIAAPVFGLVLTILILVIRRLDLAGWTIAMLGIATAAGAVIVVAWWFDKGTGAAGLQRFSPAQTAETTAAIERMFGDSGWFGSGAGTFEAIAHIYQGDLSPLLKAPTTAIALSLELGTIGLTGVMVISIIVLVKLFRGALRRGRDSFFAMAAAACVAVGMCQAFTGAGLLQPVSTTMIAIIVGLGLSQCFSQITQP